LAPANRETGNIRSPPVRRYFTAPKRQHFSYEPDPSNLRGTLSNLEQMTAALQAAGRSFRAPPFWKLAPVGSYDTHNADFERRKRS
jgi:hypothetical protein